MKPGQKRTFTETARRAQIVSAAIETIAGVGYGQASFAEIARRAGLSSTGLISYHFASKDDLIEQVVDEVVTAGQAFMGPRIEAAEGARSKLRAYLQSNLEFMASYRAHVVAVAEILSALPRQRGGQPAPYAHWHERGIAQLQDLLREGQRGGEFAGFSTRVMAVTIRAAIDAVGYQLAADPNLDLRATARELTVLFDRATGSGKPGERAAAPAGERRRTNRRTGTR
ncbi:MAG: TetR family transcriptional regulator [Solirubrobacterales bacterium]|nr:TetR family transcriptional regulator [Solirubrobacterales bacterium]